MTIPQQPPEMSGSQALGNAAPRTPGCAVGVVTGAITGGILGGVGRGVVAVAFMYAVAQSNGTFFHRGPSESLSDVIEAHAFLIVISAVIGFVVCSLAGATCRVLLAAPIAALLSALPCFVLVVAPSTFLMSMSGGNTKPHVHAVWVALAGMAVVGALAGAGGAVAGRLAMKGVWGKSDDDDHTLSWYSRSDNRIFCVTICVALLSATAAAIYTYRSTTGQMLFAGCVFFLVLVAWLFVSVPVVAFAFMKTQASIADHKEKIVYETLAKSVNGRIYRNERFFGTRPPAIEFLHHGLRVVIDSEHRRAGGHYLHYARATLDLPRPIPFRCDLSPHGWLDAALIPGHQDVQIGASVFDDEFRVKTNDDKLVVQVLDETVQLRLMQLKGVSKSILTGLLDTGRVYLLIDAHRIQIRAQGVITESEEMTEFYRQSSELFNELLPRLGLLP